MTSKFLSVAHVAELLDVSESQVRQLIANGEFSVLTVGRGSRPAARIPAAEVDEFIARRTHPRRPRPRRGAA